LKVMSLAIKNSLWLDSASCQCMASINF
jgi:hypothetical protein